jgi:hypothetical protein
MTRESDAEQQKTLQNIRSLHATWFRDILPTATPKFVSELKLAKQNGLKFLVNVVPLCADYDRCENENAGEDFRKRCGWDGGSPKISEMNLNKFAQRFRAQLDAVKAANLTIDAFEIGNEIDWICFNGDVPNGHQPSQEELFTAVRGYAHFLRTAGEIIQDSHYFPNAKIITFGMAHAGSGDIPPHHFSDPARLVAMLRNLDGFNYLDNSHYHVAGYGTHIYPDPNKVEQSSATPLVSDAKTLNDKPFWITEWGLGSNSFPNKLGETRGDAIKKFYAVLEQTHVSLGPVFYFGYAGGSGLLDKNGTLLPEANALSTGAGEGAMPPHK